MAENLEPTKAPAADPAAAAPAKSASGYAPRPAASSADGPRGYAPRGPRPGGGRPRPGGGGGKKFFRRRKVDYFSVNKIDDINYKNVDSLKQFLGDRGKILPRRHTGLSSQHQRQLRKAIKRARNIALLPFTAVR